MRVLIVDDDRLSKEMLKEHLVGWGYGVCCASDAKEALRLLTSDDSIALVITDWVMPGMDGPELCGRIRAMDRERYLPIILVTALEGGEHLSVGLDAGADAFLTKPLRPAALLAQIRVAERILGLEERLETRVRNLEDANARIRRDLEAAAVVQKSHLPSAPPQLPSVDFAWVYNACQTLGGDMFNVFRLDEDHVGMYVLDVSGHGTSAALLSVSLSRALIPFPQQGGILKRVSPEPPYYEIVSPADVASELNRRFQLIEQSGHYCTFIYGILDLRSRVFSYVSAGHPGPIQVSGGQVSGCPARSHDEGAGVPIGVLDEAEYSEIEIRVLPGSHIILYTDGVNERNNDEGEEFGKARILGVLAERMPDGRERGIERTVRTLYQRVEEFGKGESQRDDITILGVGVA